jgi:hypothetical protein
MPGSSRQSTTRKHLRSLPLSALLPWCDKEGLQLHGPDGTLVTSAKTVLKRVADGKLELDHDLTVCSEVASALELDALWYRILSAPGQAREALLLPAGEASVALRALAPELTQVAWAVCDPRGRLADISDNAERLLGFLADSPLTGRSLPDLLGLAEPSLLLSTAECRIEIEVPIERREIVPLQILAVPHRDLSGRMSGWLARLSMKPYLPNPAIDWQTLMEHFPGVVVRLDRDGRVIFSNRRVGGFTAEKAWGRPIFDFVREDSRITAQALRDQVVRGRSPLSGELPIYDPQTQETIWYSFHAVPIPRGGDVDVLVYATDISLRVQAERDLRDSKRHILALSSRLDRAQEEERRRISRELHDELGGMLTALRLEVGGLEKQKGLPRVARARLETLESLLATTLATVRRLSTQLRPQILDDLGLSAALESLLRDASARSQFIYECQVPLTLPGNPDLHLHLYRVCQEALTNICRHARARKVQLSITRPFRGRLRLVIEDDGVGFCVDAANEQTTLGLSGIAERIQLLGGCLELKSAPGQGCRLEAEIPIKPLSPGHPEPPGLPGSHLSRGERWT